MKGTYPRFVYILMTLLGVSVLVINAYMDLTVAVCAIGAGLFAYGVNRLIGEWRVRSAQVCLTAGYMQPCIRMYR